MLVDRDTGLPAFWPTLFVTTQVRNKGQSVAAMEVALGAINVLLSFTEKRGIDLEERVLKREYLREHELDALRDWTQRVQGEGRGETKAKTTVGAAHAYNRLNQIAKYLQWFARALLANRRNAADDDAIKALINGLLSRRPKQPGEDYLLDRALSDETYERLMEVVEPTHPSNPFADERTAERNALAVHLLTKLGLRRGELLGIKVGDIQWADRTITIHRRPDDPHDPRTHQPRTKTLARKLNLSDHLIERVHRYVKGARRKTKRANTHEFLLVAHRRDSNEGQPLSISGLNKVFEVLRGCDPLLEPIHAHALRHYWNWQFSDEMDEQIDKKDSDEGKGKVKAEEEDVRNYQMGWMPGSKMGQRYNLRHIVKKAHEASRTLQRDISRRRKQKDDGEP